MSLPHTQTKTSRVTPMHTLKRFIQKWPTNYSWLEHYCRPFLNFKGYKHVKCHQFRVVKVMKDMLSSPSAQRLRHCGCHSDSVNSSNALSMVAMAGFTFLLMRERKKSMKSFNPFRTKTQKYLFLRGKDLYFIIKLATQISLFSLQISKT